MKRVVNIQGIGVPLIIEMDFGWSMVGRDIRERIAYLADRLSDGEGLGGVCINGEMILDGNPGDTDILRRAPISHLITIYGCFVCNRLNQIYRQAYLN